MRCGPRPTAPDPPLADRAKHYLAGFRLHEPAWERDRILYGPRAAHLLRVDNTGDELDRMYDLLIRMFNAANGGSSGPRKARSTTERYEVLRRAHRALYGDWCGGWEERSAHVLDDGEVLTVEHVHDRSQGGTNRRSNLAVLCSSCNQALGRAAYLARRGAGTRFTR